MPSNKTFLSIFIGVISICVISYFIYKIRKSSSFEKRASFRKLVLVRHGEKPKNGLGNLDCQGLNRSLRLPNVLLSKFGQPDYIFAPNPARKIWDKGVSFNYIRPLVTIEPTAIRCDMPINSDYGFTDIEGLLNELTSDKYKDKLIFVAWEHHNLEKFAKLFARTQMVDSRDLKPENEIPKWKGSDFDSIFIFTSNGHSDYSPYNFTIDHEGLNNMSTQCPY